MTWEELSGASDRLTETSYHEKSEPTTHSPYYLDFPFKKNWTGALRHCESGPIGSIIVCVARLRSEIFAIDHREERFFCISDLSERQSFQWSPLKSTGFVPLKNLEASVAQRM